MATIYEVCDLAGVSLATVSRVINNAGNVSAKTQQKVKAAMDQLGYMPNTAAQSLASNRSNSVGVLVSELSGPFFGPLMQAIESNLRKYGKHAIIAAGHSTEQQETDAIEFLISKNCDALIIHADSLSDDYLAELSKKETPIFVVNRHIDSIADQCLYLDNELGSYLATKALIDLGHKQIANITGPLWKTDSKERLSGYKRALQESNLAVDESILYEGDFQESGGINGVKHLLMQSQPFTAIVCGNDEMASGALDQLRISGKSIPEDVSVFGFDNVTFASYLYPKLTTIDFPIQEMGLIASNLVLSTVYDQKNLETNKSFEPKIILRNSISKA